MIIDEEGLQALTVARIGERAGYSRGMVTERFGSKEGLIAALLDAIVDRLRNTDMMPEMEGRTGIERLDVYLTQIAKQAIDREPWLRVLARITFEAIGLDREPNDRFALVNAAIRSDLADIVRMGIEDGTIRNDADPESEAVMFVAAFRGVAYQWVVDRDGLDPGAALSYTRSVTLERLAPEGRNSPSLNLS